MRYTGYDFLIDSLVLADAKDKTLTFYHANFNGQIYDLKNPKTENITCKLISNLIKRLNSKNYNYMNAKVIDPIIYNSVMTQVQRAKCKKKPYSNNLNPVIIETDSYKNAIYGLCGYLYYYIWAGKPDRPNIDEAMGYVKFFV
ncbi:hypothetical protein FACS1894187_05710 [Synergistales bacterium]|nr:hypothetical protein FACS1894187_05710 [Synergistales bacterium]